MENLETLEAQTEENCETDLSFLWPPGSLWTFEQLKGQTSSPTFVFFLIILYYLYVFCIYSVWMDIEKPAWSAGGKSRLFDFHVDVPI